MSYVERFIDWIAEDPFWNTLMVLCIFSMTSCTAHDIVKTWAN